MKNDSKLNRGTLANQQQFYYAKKMSPQHYRQSNHLHKGVKMRRTLQL